MNYLHLMKKVAIAILCVLSVANAQDKRFAFKGNAAQAGSSFVWNVTDSAEVSDSLRFIQGSNITLTQSGNTLTIAGAASSGISSTTAQDSTGWKRVGTSAFNTGATYYRINGKYQRLIMVDTDNDSVIVAPHALYMITAKDGSTILAVIDSSGNIYSGNPTGTSVALSPTSANNPTIYFREATDFANDYFTIQYEGAENRLIFNGAENDAGNAYFQFQDNVDIGGVAGDPVSKLVLSDGGSGVVAMRAANGSTGTTSIDGTTYGIDANEAASIWNYENTAMNFATNNTTRMIVAAAGGIGVGATTETQANRAKWNVLGRAANDTLAVFSNDGGGAVGDSAWTLLPNMHWNFGTGANTAMIDFPASPSNEILWAVRAAGAPRILLGRDASSQYGTLSYDGTNTSILNANSSGDILLNSFGGFRVASAGSQAIIAATSTKGKQAFLTVNANGTADTTLIVRNDKDATLDSTAMVFANGSGYFGGNNLYLGGHRIRSNAAGDSLIFYDGSTMIFAILSDGTTADLVATTPFWKFFDKFRNEVLFWILAVAGILACILALLSIYAKVRTIRFGGYETLAENL